MLLLLLLLLLRGIEYWAERGSNGLLYLVGCGGRGSEDNLGLRLEPQDMVCHGK